MVHITGGVSSYFASLYTLPIIAASTVQSWRGGLMVTVLSSAMYAALVIAQYQRTDACRSASVPGTLPAARVALFTVGLNIFGFIAVAGAERLPGRRAAPNGRAARGDLDPARRSAGVQPARHRQPDERPRHLRHAGPAADVQPRGGGDYPARGPEAVGQPAFEILQLPVRSGRCSTRPMAAQTRCSASSTGSGAATAARSRWA